MMKRFHTLLSISTCAATSGEHGVELEAAQWRLLQPDVTAFDAQEEVDATLRDATVPFGGSLVSWGKA